MTCIGVISDTHGLIRPQALEALQGCDSIIHAGDVGDPAIVDALAKIAPVLAIRGNVDRGDWARSLPEAASVEAENRRIYVLHSLDDLDFEPEVLGFHVVIYGHSHRPSIETRNGVLYLNPGSAGPRRFDLPVTVAHLTFAEGGPSASVIDITG